MNPYFRVATACLIYLTIAGCNPPSQDQAPDNTSQSVDREEESVVDGAQGAAEPDGPPEFVRALWQRSVDIAKPCENAAAVLADRIAFTSPQNAKPEAQKGLKLCENALAKQNALQVPEEADGDLAITLDAAIHQCREALDARRKFFESSIMVLDGDTSQWRTGMVETSSMMAEGRSDDCIALFREAGLEI